MLILITFVIILELTSIFYLLNLKFFITTKTFYSANDNFVISTTVPKVNDIKNKPHKNIKNVKARP